MDNQIGTRDTVRLKQSAPALGLIVPRMLHTFTPQLEVYLDENLRGSIMKSARDAIPNEAMGILFGQIFRTGSRVRVFIQHESEVHDHNASAHAFTYSAEEKIRIADKAKHTYPDLQIVGFWHSHPAWGMELSGADLNTFDSDFAHKYQIGLLVLPAEDQIGVFVRDDVGTVPKTPVGQFHDDPLGNRFAPPMYKPEPAERQSTQSRSRRDPQLGTPPGSVAGRPDVGAADSHWSLKRWFLVCGAIGLFLLVSWLMVSFFSTSRDASDSYGSNAPESTEFQNPGPLSVRFLDDGFFLTWSPEDALNEGEIKTVSLARESKGDGDSRRTLTPGDYVRGYISDKVKIPGTYTYVLAVKTTDGQNIVLRSTASELPADTSYPRDSSDLGPSDGYGVYRENY